MNLAKGDEKHVGLQINAKSKYCLLLHLLQFICHAQRATHLYEY